MKVFVVLAVALCLAAVASATEVDAEWAQPEMVDSLPDPVVPQQRAPVPTPIAIHQQQQIPTPVPTMQQQLASQVAASEQSVEAVPTEMDEMRFAQSQGRRRWDLINKIKTGIQKVGGAIKGGIKGAIDGFKNAGKPNAPPPKPSTTTPPPAVPPPPSPTRTAADIEDCVACRYIWLKVELQVGNTQIEENIYDAFTQSCIEAQKAPIFYPACEDMFDDVYGMIGDYMDGYTVNQMCEAAKLCR